MSECYMTCSDEELLRFMQEHDDELAFGEVYNRYFRLLFNYTYEKVSDQFTAQEIVQELFVSLWQQRARSTIQALRPYLFACAKNQVISFYRKEYTRQKHIQAWGNLGAGTAEAGDQLVLTDDLQHRYEEGLRQLPDKCREVFWLSRQGFSHREIGEKLHISEKTVEQHITKALRFLKIHLKEHLLDGFYLLILFFL
ncbi:RNA polymerase sigma factor [Arundinibacter roseus]|uniref:RNA polymerase sigma-70 factor n=1 Tax=Arundinibacter roseus TaxID=2070510 RepID=A0A4R4KE52_9BACT|nr:RNA polymerase sigma-70 factor [Arundinibacter roseus]TDB65953.1 RNA polymerase sigma-70 factor [Arundinibacter roseus]